MSERERNMILGAFAIILTALNIGLVWVLIETVFYSDQRCAERWAPRETEYGRTLGCRVKIDGEWWPEYALRGRRP